MKAAVRRRWGEIEVADVPTPEPAADEVLVRVHASSINRSDFYAFAGGALLMRPLLCGARLGGDFAGVAEAAGDDVHDIQPGDEVFGARSGAFAEYVAVKTAVARKPGNLTFEEAAAVPIGALTALEALRDRGGLRAGHRVLVNGASGGVGVFAVQLAKALGAGHVTAVCSTRNVEQAHSLGADRVIDYIRDDYTRGDDRYDLIVDIAGSHSWRANRRVLTPDGRLVLVGLPMGNGVTGPLGPLAHRWLTSRVGRKKLAFFVCKPNRANLATLRELIESGSVKPLVDRVYPLSDIADALSAMGRGHTQGKLVVRI